MLVRPGLQLEEEEEPRWGSKWEDSKGEFVFGSLGVWGGALVPCAQQVFWKSVQRQLLSGGHPTFRALRPVLGSRRPHGPRPEPSPDCREVSGW